MADVMMTNAPPTGLGGGCGGSGAYAPQEARSGHSAPPSDVYAALADLGNSALRCGVERYNGNASLLPQSSAGDAAGGFLANTRDAARAVTCSAAAQRMRFP